MPNTLYSREMKIAVLYCLFDSDKGVAVGKTRARGCAIQNLGEEM